MTLGAICLIRKLLQIYIHVTYVIALDALLINIYTPSIIMKS